MTYVEFFVDTYALDYYNAGYPIEKIRIEYMPIKQVSIKVAAYTTPEGKPTCCLDITKDLICPFLRVKKMGTLDECALNHYPILTSSETGYTEPGTWCPLWNEGESDDNF